MKQEISPKTFMIVIAVVAVVAVGTAVWIMRAPSAPSVDTSSGKVVPGRGRGMMEEMRALHSGNRPGMNGMGAGNANASR